MHDEWARVIAIMVKWLDRVVSSFPFRCMPIVTGEFNDHFGISRGEYDWSTRCLSIWWEVRVKVCSAIQATSSLSVFLARSDTGESVAADKPAQNMGKQDEGKEEDEAVEVKEVLGFTFKTRLQMAQQLRQLIALFRITCVRPATLLPVTDSVATEIGRAHV